MQFAIRFSVLESRRYVVRSDFLAWNWKLQTTCKPVYVVSQLFLGKPPPKNALAGSGLQGNVILTKALLILIYPSSP